MEKKCKTIVAGIISNPSSCLSRPYTCVFNATFSLDFWLCPSLLDYLLLSCLFKGVYMDVNAEKRYFLDALRLFYETQWLHNIPVTEILTQRCLDAIPREWMERLRMLQNDELNNFVVEKTTKSEWPDSLKAYANHCEGTNRLLPALTLPAAELPRNFRTGLGRKKQHEVMHLARLVHAQCKPHDIQTIIDLGAGLGYVCQMLHHLYGYRVLGLEKDKENVNRACSRQRESYPESLTNVRYIHCDVTCDSADRIESILQREFLGTTAACMIGLHACGDLSTSASRIFRRMSVRTPLQEKQYFRNFPMSNCLREVIASHSFDVGQFLRVPFLRLACQESADKWRGMSGEKHGEHSFHVLARAVLELYSHQNNLVLRKKVRKGTRKSQCTDFQTYVKDSLTRYDLAPKPDMDLRTGDTIMPDELEEDITRVWEKQREKLQAVEIYTGLQMMLQLPAESLILQDRLCWLHEQGFEAVIVPVMNKRLSPRSHAIVSRKR